MIPNDYYFAKVSDISRKRNFTKDSDELTKAKFQKLLKLQNELIKLESSNLNAAIDANEPEDFLRSLIEITRLTFETADAVIDGASYAMIFDAIVSNNSDTKSDISRLTKNLDDRLKK